MPGDTIWILEISGGNPDILTPIERERERERERGLNNSLGWIREYRQLEISSHALEPRLFLLAARILHSAAEYAGARDNIA